MHAEGCRSRTGLVDGICARAPLLPILAMKPQHPVTIGEWMWPLALSAIRIKVSSVLSANGVPGALVPRRHGPDAVLTGLLVRSALFGVLAQVVSFGLDLLESATSAPLAARNEHAGPDLGGLRVHEPARAPSHAARREITRIR